MVRSTRSKWIQKHISIPTNNNKTLQMKINGGIANNLSSISKNANRINNINLSRIHVSYVLVGKKNQQKKKIQQEPSQKINKSNGM